VKNNPIPIRLLEHSGWDLLEHVENGGAYGSGTQNETKETV
jgi:hypothetical protein